MDADTRHQLRQNELAEALARLRDFTDRRTLAWLGVIVAIALAYGGYRYWRWRQEVQLAQSFRVLSTVNALAPELGEAPLEQLRELIAKTSDPAVRALARLELAQGLEARAVRDGDPARLAEAEAEYQKLMQMPGVPNHLKAAALYRLGMVYESQRDFARARQAFTTLSTDPRFEGTPQKTRATLRLGELDELAVAVHFEPGAKPLPAVSSQPTAGPPSADLPGAVELPGLDPQPAAPAPPAPPGSRRQSPEP